VSADTLAKLKAALSERYDVQRELARGGMGHVFEARDVKHGRPVAIKILDPELAASIGAARFRSEIETVARLSHPHIVPLFDSGEAAGLLYYVMPLVVGEPLRQRIVRERQLAIDDALRIAREVADALGYAHDQGMIHRDVKPENVVLSGGHALVLDFGIARSSDTTRTSETSTLVTIGTPTYMSPEQISGAGIDGRADQYALACVVYEMVTGQPPFTGPTGESVLSQHRSADPRPATALRPAAPASVTQALARALAKSPADRFPTMAAFSSALGGAGAPALHSHGAATPGGLGKGRFMLAVLPLENRSADPEQEYFTDGMTEELITHLARLQPKRLGVIARTSAMRYKKTTKSAQEIGRELGVDFLLEGSVRRAGDRIRITTQLIQVTDQSHLWSETYERRLADVFELQDEVAAAVAKALEVELVAPQLPTQSVTEAADSEAYEAYLKGRFHWNKRTPDSLRLAIQWFERAIEADPKFARAYAGLADVYTVQVTYLQATGEESFPSAERAARRAIELEPRSVEARTSHASVLMHGERYEEAGREFETALEIDPNYVPALYWGSILHVSTGRIDGALELVNRARRLDPLSVIVEIVHGNVYFFSGRPAEALRHYRRALELEPRLPWIYMRVALGLAANGQLEEALRLLDELEPGIAGSLDMVATRANILGRLGRLDDARALVATLRERSKREYVSWNHFAYALAGVDDRGALFDVISRASQKENVGRLMLKHDPAFEAIRRDPRFRAILPAEVTANRTP